jgi:tyrosine-protein kinase Etk/Wzc
MEDELDIRKYGRVFLRRKWVFLSVLLGILLFTWIRTVLTPKTYLASSRVLVRRTSTMLGESRILEEAFGIETNCEILKSRGFMERVVDHMKEENGESELFREENVPAALVEMTRISPLKNTDIIGIEARAPSAKEASWIANSVAEVFRKYSVEIARAKITEKRKFIENQLPAIEEKLKESEQMIQKFKEDEGLVSVNAGGSALQKELMSLQAQHSAMLSQISTKEALLASLEEEIERENKRLAEEIVKIDNTSLLSLRSQLVRFGNKHTAYVVAGLSEDHPKLVELDKKIREIQKKLREKAEGRLNEEVLLTDPLFFLKELSKKIIDERSNLFSLKAMRTALEQRIVDYTSRVRKFPEKEYELAGLERNYKFNVSLYERLIGHCEETKITEVSEIGNVVITEKAIPPLYPTSPNPRRNMSLALVLGLGLGIGGALLWEHMDTSIKDVDEMRQLKIPETGTIPVVGTIPEHTESLVEDPMSPAAEAYKKLRMNLKFSAAGLDGGELRTLLVTSCSPKEGKTTIAANLGCTYARADTRTIVIGADLRHPQLQKSFDISQKTGLTNLLVGDAKKEEVICPSGIDNLSVIPAGYLPPDPAELLESDRMRNLISELKEEFEMVIIDSPPLMSCADGFLLGSMVDGVALVLELGGTPREYLLQTIGSFKVAEATLVGVVVNKVKERGRYGYHYYHYYYRPQTSKV